LLDIAFGTWKIQASQAKSIVEKALQVGYRHYDTAAAYANENDIGEAIAQADVAREALLISAKLWTSKRSYDAAIKACRRSLKNLQLTYFDQYLIHWPAVPALYANWQEMNTETWHALETLKQDGLVHSIGLCNFRPHHIDALLQHANIKPSVNQIEYHPGYNQPETVEYCKKNDIKLEAWSPLGNGLLLTHPMLQKIADDHNISVAQVCIRWCIQHDVLPIIKTVSIERMKMNRQVFQFELSTEEMREIDMLPVFGYSGLDPDTVTQFG